MLHATYPTAISRREPFRPTSVAMRMVLLIAMLCGCGDNDVQVAPDAAAEPEIAPPKCSELECAYTICDSCPVCGHPEWTCQCYGADDVGVACSK